MKIHKTNYSHFFCRWSWITNDLRENKNTFRQIVNQRVPFKNKGNSLYLQRLRCREYMTTALFIITSTTQHLNLLGAILVYICSDGETMEDREQLTQGGAVVKHRCQSTIVGGAWVCVTSHSQESENCLIWESDHYYWGFKLKHCVDFYHYRVVVYTHCQHTFMFKHHVKVNFASDNPFNANESANVCMLFITVLNSLCLLMVITLTASFRQIYTFKRKCSTKETLNGKKVIHLADICTDTKIFALLAAGKYACI